MRNQVVRKALVALALMLPILVMLGCGDNSVEQRTDAAVTDTGAECAEGCLLDAVCYPDGVVNPSNVCERCDPEVSPSAWSDNDGARCDDGAFCNGADTCSGGTCSVHADDPCSDDGFFCNGVESCNEVTDSCESTGNPCQTDDLCQEMADSYSCCTPGVIVSSNLCNANADVVQIDECGLAVPVEDCLDPSMNGGCQNGICGCAQGWRGASCDQCVVHVATFGSDMSAGTSWATAKATVQAGITAATADGCDVWVARGTYFPARADRNATFQLVSGVAVYGGFYGNETSFEERDWEFNKTILSGEIGASAVGVWHETDVNVACAATDNGSGLANPADAAFTLSTNVPSGTETHNAVTGTHEVCDAVGHCSTVGPLSGYKIDKKAPVVSIVGPGTGQYIQGETLVLDYTVTDGGSGVSTVSATLNGSPSVAGDPLRSGLAIDLSSLPLGENTFRVNAVDGVGNASPTSSVIFTVVTAE